MQRRTIRTPIWLAVLAAALLAPPANAAVRTHPATAPQLGFAAAAAPATLRPFAQADQSYADPTGDSGTGADISAVSVASVGTRLEFRVEYANRACVGAKETLYVPLDVDVNPRTGWNAPDEGAEYLVEVDGSTNRVTLYRWGGAEEWQTELRSERAECTAGDAFGFERSQLAAGSAFRFYAGTVAGDADGYADVAPDGEALYDYVSPVDPPPVETPVATFTVSPGRHRIGDTITFTADGVGYESYLWDFGDGGAATGRVVRHVFRKPGTATVSLHAAHHGVAADLQRGITVRGVPTADQLPTIAGPNARSRKDPAYSRLATQLARGPRSVFCWNNEDWPLLLDGRAAFARGFVEVRARRQVHLSPDVCRNLDLLRYRSPRPQPTLGIGISVLILAHEVMHTVGIGNEALATCYGVQVMRFVAGELGAGDAYADRLTQRVWKWYKPANVARGYWSPKCRNGSAWDLYPEDDSFP